MGDRRQWWEPDPDAPAELAGTVVSMICTIGFHSSCDAARRGSIYECSCHCHRP